MSGSVLGGAAMTVRSSRALVAATAARAAVAAEVRLSSSAVVDTPRSLAACVRSSSRWAKSAWALAWSYSG